MTRAALPIKKPVSLTWRGMRLSFDVAQELFSSHQVDTGSRLLLTSLDPLAFSSEGMAADFGCGYGVLGIAWQRVRPGWSMHYVDRDALAVAFSEHNASRYHIENTAFSADIALPADPRGYDLVLWNVPGKAGRPVLAGLLDAIIDALAPKGLLAVVVVHPLADVFAAVAREDIEITHLQHGNEHTVVHVRRTKGEVVARDPFGDGLFDRPEATFSAAGIEWSLVPVHGLPEYDELSHATRLAAELLAAGASEEGRSVECWMVMEPAVGHLACAASRLWPNATGTIIGRDELAIRAASRSLGDTPHDALTVWGLEVVEVEKHAAIATVALPVQASAAAIGRALDAMGRNVAPSGEVILYGRSTEVARAEREVRRRPGWRATRPVKQRGFAAMSVRTPAT